MTKKTPEQLMSDFNLYNKKADESHKLQSELTCLYDTLLKDLADFFEIKSGVYIELRTECKQSPVGLCVHDSERDAWGQNCLACNPGRPDCPYVRHDGAKCYLKSGHKGDHSSLMDCWEPDTKCVNSKKMGRRKVTPR